MQKKQIRNLQKLNILSWENILNDFLLVKRASGRSKRTVFDYERHVKFFFSKFPNCWGTSDLSSCVLEYMSQQIKPATYNLRLVYLKAFFDYCIEHEYLTTENPLKGLKKRKAEDRIVDIQVDVLMKILNQPNQNTFSGLRDYCLLVLTLDTGIRPSEALGLKLSDFDLNYNQVTVPFEVAKTRTSRILPILPSTSNLIKKFISYRLPQWSNIPVFCTCSGTPLNEQTYRNRLRKYSLNVGQQITPYDLRHAFAIMYLRNGGNAFGLAQTLGHTDMEMTKKYVYISGTDLKEAHINSSPLHLLKQSKERIGLINHKNNR